MVVAAGGTRSGSTVLYNALRILLRVRDPNSVAGWHADLTSIADRYSAGGPGARTATGDALRVLRETSTVLVKVHVLAEWFSLAGEVSLKDAADAVFASHRDVREVVASLRRLGWARPVTAADLARADFCARPARRSHPPLHDAAFSRTDAWVLAARAHIRCRDALMDDAGGALKADLPASKLSGLDFEAAVALLRELGQHLDYDYSYDELAVAARELVRLEPPGCVEGDGAFMELNPVTHLHRGHVKGEQEGDERDRRGMKAIGEDKISSEWLVRLGYEV